MWRNGSRTITITRWPPSMTAACQGRQAHTGYMGRIFGTILGAILAIWLAVAAAGGIFATLKMFLIIGLIAMAVVIAVWLVARRPHRG
jgi:predicted lipid-binding transport protein (Tim44 family)